MQKRRRRVIAGNQGIKVGPRAFAIFKKLHGKVYQLKIIGRDEAQYLYNLKTKRKKQYEKAKEIEVLVAKPVTLTGLYEECEDENTMLIVDGNIDEEGVLHSEGEEKDDLLWLESKIVDAIFYSEKITKITVNHKASEVVFEPTRSFYLSPYSYEENEFYSYALENAEAVKASTGLKEFIVDENCINYSSEGAGLYNKEETELIHYGSGEDTFEIKSTITNIKPVSVAFRDSLVTIEIPEENKNLNIEKYAFLYCEKLETLKVPKTVTQVGDKAFEGCPVKTLHLASNTKHNPSNLDGWSFWFKDTLEYLEIYDNEISGIVEQEYNSCHELKDVILYDNINYLGRSCFENCIKIENMTLGHNFEFYGENVFKDAFSRIIDDEHKIECSEFDDNYHTYYYKENDIYLSIDNVNSTYKFNQQKNLHETLYLPIGTGILNLYNVPLNSPRGSSSDNQGLGWYAGLKCSYLNILNILGSNLGYIPEKCFYYSPMKIVNIYNIEELEIRRYAFLCCYNLEFFNFEPVTKIGINAFLDCISLKNSSLLIEGLIFNEKLKEINRKSFYNCYSVENIYIPKNVEILDNVTPEFATFGYCLGIKHVLYNSAKNRRNENPNTQIPTCYMFYKAGNNEFQLTENYNSDIHEYYYYENKVYNLITIYNETEFNRQKFNHTNLYILISKEIPDEPNVILEIGNDVVDIPTGAFYHFNFNNVLFIPDNIYGIGTSSFENSGMTGLIFSNTFETNEYVPSMISNDTDTARKDRYRIQSSAFAKTTNLNFVCLSENMLVLPTSMFRYSSLAKIQAGNTASSENGNLTHIQQVGKYCFSNCQNLKEIIFGDFPNLYEECFSNCYNLTNIEIRGNNYFDEYEEVFTYDSSILKYYILENECYTWILCEWSSAFDEALIRFGHLYKRIASNKLFENSFLNSGLYVAENDETVKVTYSNNATMSYGLSCFNGSYITEIDFGPVKSISYRGKYSQAYIYDDGILYNFPKLKKMTSNNITCIPYYAFNDSDYYSRESSYCPELEELVFNNVKEISWYAFAKSKKLKTINLPKLERTAGLCFADCISLKTINLPEFIEDQDGCFSGCTALTTVNIPKIEKLDGTFIDCINLSAITISSTPRVLKILGSAFSNCQSLPENFFNSTLASIFLSDSSIEVSSFENCIQFKDMTLPNNFKIISRNNVYYPTNRTAHTYLYYNLFRYDNIEHLYSNNSNYISSGNCIIAYDITTHSYRNYDHSSQNYTDVENAVIMGSANSVIPTSGVSVIASDAFIGNQVISEIKIPFNINKIYYGAFRDCINLSAVYLYQLTNISPYAFEGCTSLNTVYYDSSLGTPADFKIRINSDGNSTILNATWIAI